MRQRIGLYLWQTATIMYCVVIFYLSSLSHVPGISSLPGGTDKIIHMGEYAVLSYLSWNALGMIRALPLRISATWTGTTAFALSDEIHQMRTPGREADFWDWLADVTGITLVLVVVAVRRKKP